MIAPQLRALKAAADGTSVYWTLQAQAEDIRRETWRGVEHVVVPIVALVEGVIQCQTCPAPELALASEFAKVLDTWNGLPVTMRHPVNARGEPVAASSPKILEAYQIGQTFGAELLEDTKLRVEAWLNPDLIEAVGDEAKATLERIEAGERVEVSVGMFVTPQAERGRFNGRTYAAVQREIRGDHVAILGESEKGACSWEDGCGVRANTRLIVASCHCGGSCSREPKKRDSKPGSTEPARERETIEARVLGTMTAAIESGPRLRPNAEGISDADLRTALSAALRKVLTAGEQPFWIVAVYRDSVVYETWESRAFLERAYTLQGEQVTLADEVIEVRPVTRMVPARRGGTMDRETAIAQLIANSATRYTEDDRTWLEGLTDDQLGKLEPAEREPATAVTLDTLSREQIEKAARGQGLEVREPERQPQTTEEALASFPPEIRAEIQRGIRASAERKANLVAAIGEKTKAYSKDRLEAMSPDDLETLGQALEIDKPESGAPEHLRRVPSESSRNEEITVPNLRDQIAGKSKPAAA